MTTGPSTAQRRAVALLLLLVALGGLGLVTLGAAADRGPGPTFPDPVQREVEPFDPPDPPTMEQATPPEMPPPPPPSAGGGRTVSRAVLVLLALAVVVLAVWVLLRMRRLARPDPALAAEVVEDELTAEQARSALDQARDRLSHVVDAHDAVVAAWLALEAAIAEAGVRRAPTQTTLEFVVEVLGALDLPADALDRFAHLYRRALFDPAPLQEVDREEAVGLLDRLTDALDAPAEGSR